MRSFQGIIFIGTWTFGDIFKSASVCLYWDIKFPQQNIKQSKLGLVKRICQWNCCQSFSENLLLGTLIICSVNAQCIWDENTFIKNFYTNYSFFNWIWRSICFKLCTTLTESNKCLSIFPPNKQIFYCLPDTSLAIHNN